MTFAQERIGNRVRREVESTGFATRYRAAQTEVGSSADQDG